MAKQLNKQKKIDHRGRALHTAKSLFAVCCLNRHTPKMVARASWELALPCACSVSSRQSLRFCRVPGQAAHGKAWWPEPAGNWLCRAPAQAAHDKASDFAVCQARQHTAKHGGQSQLGTGFAVRLDRQHTAKLAVIAMAAVTLLLCAECQKDTRH